ncbi:PROTEIN FLX-LIKE 2, partial [Salix viminalis]
MASKGRIPPPHLRRPLPGSGMVHPDSFGPGLHLPQGPFPPFEMLPPPEVMEQKIAAQHGEMQRLATENQRLAATHGSLRQELASAQHELQILHAHIGAVKAEREQQIRGLMDNIAKMETELKGAEPVRLELQQARAEAENLLVMRQELMSKIHQLSQDLHKVQTDVQQIPALMSELEGLRQEYQRCRVSYDYEKKLFHDHLEQLQTMEKNYITMSRELEKLRSELTKTANVDIRNVAGGSYGGPTGNNESESSGHPAGQNICEDGYGIPQGQGHPALHNSGAANMGAVGNASAGTGTPYSRGSIWCCALKTLVMRLQEALPMSHQNYLVMKHQECLAMICKGDTDMMLREDLDMMLREGLVMIRRDLAFMTFREDMRMMHKEDKVMMRSGYLIIMHPG